MHTGADPWAPGYEQLLQAMLGEAELHGHKDAHADVWLASVLPVLQVLFCPQIVGIFCFCCPVGPLATTCTGATQDIPFVSRLLREHMHVDLLPSFSRLRI